MLSLSEVEQKLLEIAGKIGAAGLLPTFGYSEQNGFPHIEVDAAGYHYITRERNIELEHFTTRDLDELMFRVFSDITFGMAVGYELKHRIEEQDVRRIIFAKQEEILASLSAPWAGREKLKHAAILKEHPFDDLAGIRAEYCRDLREQGYQNDEVWEMAKRKYPLP